MKEPNPFSFLRSFGRPKQRGDGTEKKRRRARDGRRLRRRFPVAELGGNRRGRFKEQEDNMDPYAILICRTQEQRSSTATGKGSEPEWNETFVFNVSDDVPELAIKLMDSDTFSDDFVGEAKIPLEPLFSEGRIPPTVYNVVKDEEYRGEIKIGLTFIPEDNHGRYNEENFGGWRE